MTENQQPPIAAGHIVGDTTKYIRDFLHTSLSKDDHEPCMYYFAILASACYLESVLEDFSTSWCRIKSSSDEPFQSRLMEKIGDDVNRATGLERWKQWLRVLFDVDFADTVGDNWQALRQLFVLRNQLAHGRTTKFTHFWNATNGRFVGMSIEGSSYRQPFEHLMDADIIVIPDGDVPSPAHLFTHEVAAYFFSCVESAIQSLSEQPTLKGLEIRSRTEDR